MSPGNDRCEAQAIRKKMKALRSSLAPEQVEKLSRQVTAPLWQISRLMRARRIACYFSVNGEVSCRRFITQAWSRGREVFLPVLSGKELRFAHFSPNTSLKGNRYGIPEPVCPDGDLVSGRHMDVVLTPLLAFDAYGNRLGMGAGFYDRTFHFLKKRRAWKRPCLIGLAYDFQMVNRLQPNAFDVPLHRIVTETTRHDYG